MTLLSPQPLTITLMMSLTLQSSCEFTHIFGTTCQGRGPSDTTITHFTCMAINTGWFPNSRVQTQALKGL
ncbi:hypothetical protein Bca101_020031 [Brassica carinata]